MIRSRVHSGFDVWGRVSLMATLGSLAACMGLASAGETPQPPIDPPAGYVWVLNEQYSDEFDGNALDRSKWNDYYDGWKGRPPGLFVPEAIRVADGMLQISSTILDPPQEDGKWTIACGAIQSVQPGAFHGYYETRVKASSVATSTTFWLKRSFPNDSEFGSHSTELDILECIGNAQRWAGFATAMHSNSHVAYYEKLDDEGEPLVFKTPNAAPLPEGDRVNTDFHVYGCWWENATTAHFYLNGEHVHTMEMANNIDPTPFDRPLYLNAVCETYSWEHPPKPENLQDPRKNTTQYDYIRSWTLEKADGLD
ncbi:MAG: family 16 glycosylhydrolase [Planctomycetota bacterium]